MNFTSKDQNDYDNIKKIIYQTFFFGISYLTNCPSPSSSRQFGLRSYLGLRLLYILPYTLRFGFAYAFHHVIIKRKQKGIIK